MLLLIAIWLAVWAPPQQPDRVVLVASDVNATYFDSVPQGVAADRPWLGLFVSGGAEEPPSRPIESRLQPVKLTIDIDKKTNQHLIVPKPFDVAVLISGVPQLSPGRAVTVGRSVDLRDQHVASYQLGEARYSLKLEVKAPHLCDAVVTLTSGDRVQTLFDVGKPDPGGMGLVCDDPLFFIHWAGDIDRDGNLDLVTTFSHKYTIHPRLLWLSSVARSPNLVAEVARYNGIGD